MKKKRKPLKGLPANPVAKYANTFNQSNVFTDRKKAQKKGYQKHKKQAYQGNRFQGDGIAA